MHNPPYVQYPKILKQSIVTHGAFWMNLFPREDGVSNVYSPMAIVTGKHPDYERHCKVMVGLYCEVHNE